MFDELGWPWPKHDCSGVLHNSKHISIDNPALFLYLSKAKDPLWFQNLLLELNQSEGAARYASKLDIPEFVIQDSYTHWQPSIFFLRNAAKQVQLPKGLFIPVVCRKCLRRLILHVSSSDEMTLLEYEDEVGKVPLKMHHCGAVTSQQAIIYNSIPEKMSWRFLINMFTPNNIKVSTNSVSTKKYRNLLGFVSNRRSGEFLFSPIFGIFAPVWMAETANLPIMSLIRISGDDQPELVSLDALKRGWVNKKIQTANNPDITKAPIKNKVKKESVLPLAPKCKKSFASDLQRRKLNLNSYPVEFKEREIRMCFQRLAIDHLSGDQKEKWEKLIDKYGWHFGGLLDFRDIQEFVKIIRICQRNPNIKDLNLRYLIEIANTALSKVNNQLENPI